MKANDSIRKSKRQWARAESGSDRDIGPLPPVKNWSRRRLASDSFEFWCKTYFPSVFFLDWSDFHLRCINRIEKAVFEGGWFALAMPRGMGKSSLCESAVLWTTFCGHGRYALLVGATETAATGYIESIKTELRFNDLLMEDFPEICHAIRSLEDEPKRCIGQHCGGTPTKTVWRAGKIVFPYILRSVLEENNYPSELKVGCGGVIEACGITGNIRGRNHKVASGEVIRPDLAICDDPQTRKSAKSRPDNDFRESSITGDVAYCAGPGKPISVVVPCTVIYQEDLADRLLNRELNPEWQGERTKFVMAMPTNMELWEQYYSMRTDCLCNGEDTAPATQFYENHREEMDKGSVVVWEDFYYAEYGEISALQHAMNRFFKDKRSFMAEYQNEPIESAEGEVRILSDEEIARKVNKLAPKVLPVEAEKLVAFIDVQQSVLYYLVLAWWDGFGGAVVEYGTFPDQGRQYFSLEQVVKTLQRRYPDDEKVESLIYKGLEVLVGDLKSREWLREDGIEIPLSQILIDSGYQQSVVNLFCRQSQFSDVLLPSKGYGIGAKNIPFSDRKNKIRSGESNGHFWQIRRTNERDLMRYVLIDTNFWKTFVHERLATGFGASGCLALYKTRPHQHRMFSEHLTAEFRVRTEGRGRTVDEWMNRPSRPDNHWFDCLVGCAVAGSVQGIKMIGVEEPEQKQPGRKVRTITRDMLRR